MKQRYTHKQLTVDVDKINALLDARGDTSMRFVVGGRYGYSAIDLATPEQLKKHCCERMLIGGTPRQCYEACLCYLGSASLMPTPLK